MSGRNIWSTIQNEVRGGPMSLSIFIAGLIALIIGVGLSWEDATSSLAGLRLLETVFGIQAVTTDVIVYLMAIAPQIGQIVFISLWSLDTSRRWALFVGVLWFVLDFISDMQLRSGNTFFTADHGIQFGATTYVAAGMTFIYFTIGAEMFLVAGSAIVITLFPDAVRQVALLWVGIGEAFHDAGKMMDGAKRGHRPQQQGGNQQRQNQQNQQRQGKQQQNQQRPQGQPKRENHGNPAQPTAASLLAILDELPDGEG